MRIILFFCLVLFSCQIPDTQREAYINEQIPDDCDNLGSFSSYEDAIEKVKSHDFKISESVDTDKSSWVKGAWFYSCDGETGYFIIETDKREYIHSKVPVDAWEGFKSAESFGDYYNSNIRGMYRLDL